MKKLLSLLAAAGLVATSGTVVVACGKTDKKEETPVTGDRYSDILQKREAVTKLETEKDNVIKDKEAKNTELTEANANTQTATDKLEAKKTEAEELEAIENPTTEQEMLLHYLKNVLIPNLMDKVNELQEVANDISKEIDTLDGNINTLTEKIDTLTSELNDLGWTSASRQVAISEYANTPNNLWMTEAQKEQLNDQAFLDSTEFKTIVWNGFFSANDNKYNDFETQEVASKLSIEVVGENVIGQPFFIVTLSANVYSWMNVKAPYVVEILAGTLECVATINLI